MSATHGIARALAPIFREAFGEHATVRRRGETITLTAPAAGSLRVTATVNPNAPEEPKRDKRGRFRKRTGVVVVTDADCGETEWTVEICDP
jgi:hypothetical protein